MARRIDYAIVELAERREGAAKELNELLLGSKADVLLRPSELHNPALLAEALSEVMEDHDRAGLVVAAPISRPYDTGLLDQLPLWSEIPAPDVPVALFRREVVNMVGGLDPALVELCDALLDWSMRAQRLGFVTLRAHRATVVLPQESRLSWTTELNDTVGSRHPYLEHQIREGWANPASYLTARCVDSASEISVCLDLRHVPEDAVNGTGVYAVEIARALAKLPDVRVSLWVRSAAQADAVRPLGFPVTSSPPNAIGSQILHRPAQIFHRADLAPILDSGIPWVMTFQDLIAWRCASAFDQPEGHPDYRSTSFLAAQSAQGIIAISEHNRRELERDLLVDPEIVSTVYHGVDQAFFARRDAGSNRLLLDEAGVGGPFFFLIGSDYAHKNLRLALAGYARFRHARQIHGDIPELVIVGHPSGTIDGLYAIIRERCPPGVRFLGDVSGELLRALHQEALGLVYPSAYEGFGLPILEAMASGTPVICSRMSSVPEVAGDAVLYLERGDDGELGQAMTRLETESELRSRLVHAGRTQVARFTWQSAAEKTRALYRRVIASPSTRSLARRADIRRLLENGR